MSTSCRDPNGAIAAERHASPAVSRISAPTPEPLLRPHAGPAYIPDPRMRGAGYGRPDAARTSGKIPLLQTAIAISGPAPPTPPSPRPDVKVMSRQGSGRAPIGVGISGGVVAIGSAAFCAIQTLRLRPPPTTLGAPVGIVDRRRPATPAPSPRSSPTVAPLRPV